MGNFSRNTYAPQKNYVGVRLQQGVPLVDADWNELNDVLLQETYRTAAEGIGSGVRPSNTSLPPFDVWVGGAMANDFWTLAGTLVLAGQSIQIGHTRYTSQPYFNAATAAAAGVPVVPPLITPAAPRTDVVYLDVWTREISSTEDTDLVNPVIGVETAVRIKRDYAVRVAEGTQVVPPPPAGHTHFALAYLNRTASASILSAMVIDMKPTLLGAAGPRRLSVPPLFQNGSATGAWQVFTPFLPKLFAFKNSADSAAGYLPVSLPEGCRISSVRYRGRTTGAVTFQFIRVATRPTTAFALFGPPPPPDKAITAEDYLGLASIIISPPTLGTDSAYDQTVAVSPSANGLHIVRNSEHFYVLTAYANSGVEAFITGITILYEV
ncbi:MAG TPA: DUF6519 domain-containing protein [Polyangiales bacterium]|nr:DUF6519 domain-containing protein [Polyangiales bacterium]